MQIHLSLLHNKSSIIDTLCGDIRYSRMESNGKMEGKRWVEKSVEKGNIFVDLLAVFCVRYLWDNVCMYEFGICVYMPVLFCLQFFFHFCWDSLFRFVLFSIMCFLGFRSTVLDPCANPPSQQPLPLPRSPSLICLLCSNRSVRMCSI